VEEEGTSPASPPKPVLPKSPPPVQGIPQPVAMPTSRPRFRAVLKPWLTHPLPGTILAIKVTEGDAVTRGQTLVVLEAMKMENEIPSPADGKVSSIKLKKAIQSARAISCWSWNKPRKPMLSMSFLPPGKISCLK